eukprot:9492213-Pyramimonas_sp.AAC.1
MKVVVMVAPTTARPMTASMLVMPMTVLIESETGGPEPAKTDGRATLSRTEHGQFANRRVRVGGLPTSTPKKVDGTPGP